MFSHVILWLFHIGSGLPFCLLLILLFGHILFAFLRCCCCNFIIIFLCLTWFQLVFFCFIWIIVCSYCDCCRLVLVFPKIFVIFCYVRFVWVAHSLVLSMSLHACFLQVRYIRFLCACVFITYILTHNKFIPRLTEDWAYTDKNVFTSECVVFSLSVLNWLVYTDAGIWYYHYTALGTPIVHSHTHALAETTQSKMENIIRKQINKPIVIAKYTYIHIKCKEKEREEKRHTK